MSAADRRRSPGWVTTETIAVWLLVGLAVAVIAGCWAALHLAVAFGADLDVPGNPFDALFGLIGGDLAWPRQASYALAALALILGSAGTAVALGIRRRGGGRVDPAAAHMGRGRDLAPLTESAVRATARRLGVATDQPGLPAARTVAGNQTLYADWESVCVDVWGPRTGKTTSRAILAILDAPGAVLVTSNKRDVVDGTRGPRATAGPVWVFDPQGMADEPPDWWWNPLSFVTDETRAQQLADVFAFAGRDTNARTDAYFDPAARKLLAGLLLAAALGRRPITDVYLWLSDPRDDTPAEILSHHDYPLIEASVRGIINAPDKQRAGVYGTAQDIASFLTNRQATRWVTPHGSMDTRPQLDPAELVAAGGTLYSLSMEGRGSAAPLVTALTIAVTAAAEDIAKRSRGGRLPTPMVCVLDEAANVCPWPELPKLYSHYGSRGIILLTILQSWSQGVRVWGREGMRAMWSAATVKLYGGGVSETDYLEELSRLIGDYEHTTHSISNSKHGRSTSLQTRRDRVLDVADLGSLPRGRAVLFASGVPPTLVKTIRWTEHPRAAEVAASFAAHDPKPADSAGDTP